MNIYIYIYLENSILIVNLCWYLSRLTTHIFNDIELSQTSQCQRIFIWFDWNAVRQAQGKEIWTFVDLKAYNFVNRFINCVKFLWQRRMRRAELGNMSSPKWRHWVALTPSDLLSTCQIYIRAILSNCLIAGHDQTTYLW